MNIEEYIKNEVFKKRLEKRVLVVYDAKKLYREICIGLASKNITLIDASESSIESREKALESIVSFGQGGDKLLLYVPSAAPLTDEDKQRDPFSLYGACGEVFPDGDGDSYFSLCLKAKPDHQTEVRQAFEQDPNPKFSVINSIGGGMKWPTLRALLGVESSFEIINALMLPEPNKQTELEANEAWVAEAKQLFNQVLEFNLTTRRKKLEAY